MAKLILSFSELAGMYFPRLFHSEKCSKIFTTKH